MLRGALLKSCLGPLARYSTHQETMGGTLEQVYLPSDSRFDLPGEGPLFELDFNKWWEGRGGECVHYFSHSLGHYLRQAWVLGQIWHWSKSLSNGADIVINFVKIQYLLTSKKVEGSLSKLLCMS